MLTISEPDAQGVVTVDASGAVSRDDCDRAMPEVFRLLDSYGRLRFIIDIVGVSTWGVGSNWRDLKLDMRRHGQVGRIAVIGDKRWEDWAIRIGSTLFGAETRLFSPSHVDQARDWVEAREE